jgi:hypothetical protein
MSDLVGSVTDMADYARSTPAAQAWFAGGERVGYVNFLVRRCEQEQRVRGVICVPQP